MYCPNCGNDMKEDKFCTKCGYSTASRNAVNQPVTPPATPPKKSSKGGITIILIIVVLGILAFVCGIIAIIFFTFKSVIGIESKEFIELDRFSIPSLYKVTGKKFSVCGVNYTDDDMSITLCNPVSEEKVKEYVDYLINKEDFTLFEGSYDYSLYKEDEGRVIYVFIGGNRMFRYTYNYGKFEQEESSLGV